MIVILTVAKDSHSIREFHGRTGKDPAVALRDAKLQLVRGTGAHRRPLYWAPFVLYAGT